MPRRGIKKSVDFDDDDDETNPSTVQHESELPHRSNLENSRRRGRKKTIDIEDDDVFSHFEDPEEHELPHRSHGNMPRRGRKKTVDHDDEDATIPFKVPREIEVTQKSPLNFSSPEDFFESFISPIKSVDFFTNYWEQKPLLIQRNDSDMYTYYQNLFTLTDMKKIAAQGLSYGKDLNMCKCKDGKKYALPRQGKTSYLHLMKDFGSGKATIQFHQPQRFNDKLWHIIETLECFFGTLVGSNVYITPPDSQGLPPHYDDVEVFILQLEGQKHWYLYEPTNPLAREYNVAPEDTLGAPTHDFILKPGDMLYFPRGVIHHAHTPAGSTHSTHVTISTYQNNSWADYLQDLIPGMLADSAKANIDLRRGIPRHQLMMTDISSSSAKIHTMITTMLESLDPKISLRSFEMVRDFMANRLPPYWTANDGHTEENPGQPQPKLSSTIKLRHKVYSAMVVQQFADQDDCPTELMVFAYHSLRNERKQHMMSANDESRHPIGLRFNLTHLDALKQIWEGGPVVVKELPLRNDDDKENLALALWAEGLLEVTLCKP
ncbi:ribosomal oxygenase 2 isoform 2-T2 [Discoglossus pictus]